jgi:hypothetical protein
MKNLRYQYGKRMIPIGMYLSMIQYRDLGSVGSGHIDFTFTFILIFIPSFSCFHFRFYFHFLGFMIAYRRNESIVSDKK